MKVTRHKGLSKYFTLFYWKLQFNSIFNTGRKLEIIETATFEIDDDSDLGRLLSGSNNRLANKLRYRLSLPESISDEEILSTTENTLTRSFAELSIAQEDLYKETEKLIIEKKKLITLKYKQLKSGLSHE